jgi:4-amino-4-deoxy-L-arabinose transferase-like glycosyltransferase
MDINLTLLGQILPISLALTIIGTIWFARRKDLHKLAISILVIFAWLIPVIGPACLLSVLATRSRTTNAGSADQMIRR